MKSLVTFDEPKTGRLYIPKSTVKTPVYFENPANGYKEQVKASWLWCFLFGPAYFALKSVWTHMVFSAVLALCTGGISWFIYPFFARDIIEKNYYRRGWKLVEDNKSQS